MILAFSGTRQGMTHEQSLAFADLVRHLSPEKFLHGACIGADEEAATTVRTYCKPCHIVACPGQSAHNRKHNQVRIDRQLSSHFALGISDEVLPPDGHFARNRYMVDQADLLVITPWQQPRSEPEQGSGGGTWYTAQYAMQIGKPLHILWPDGSSEKRLST